MKKRNLLARSLRAAGRLLLFVGLMIGIGLTGISIYLYFYQFSHPGASIAPVITQPSEIVQPAGWQPDAFTILVISTCSIVFAAFLLWLIAKIYNRHMRSFIAKLAHLFHAQIFTVEIVLTLLAWTVATILLIFTFPLASVLTLFAFIINELLFIFAWGAYGQPNYKI